MNYIKVNQWWSLKLIPLAIYENLTSWLPWNFHWFNIHKSHKLKNPWKYLKTVLHKYSKRRTRKTVLIKEVGSPYAFSLSFSLYKKFLCNKISLLSFLFWHSLCVKRKQDFNFDAYVCVCVCVCECVCVCVCVCVCLCVSFCLF